MLRTLATTAAILIAAILVSARPAAQGGCGIAPYGVGLGGANTGNLFCNSTPSVGSFLVFEMNDFSPGPQSGPGMGALILTASPANLPLLGGTLLVDLSTILDTRLVNYDIYAMSIVPIPDEPGLAGVRVWAQTGLFFPLSLGWTFSNGLRITLCP